MKLVSVYTKLSGEYYVNPFEIRTKNNEVGKAKSGRRARLQHITEAKPLEFMAIAKREAFKEKRSETQRNERKAKRK